MKKRNLLISSIVALFLLSACGGKNPKTNSDESSVTPVSEESTPVEESSITPASEESLLDSEEESTPVEESVITSEEEEAIEPMNYDDVEQFQITEPNVNDLSDKIAEVIAETLKGFETSAGFDISAKDLSLDLRAKTQKVIHPEEESEDLSEELVSEYVSEMEPVSELTSEAEPIIVEDTINVGIKDVGFNVSLGETILKNEEEDTSNLLGYMELKDTKGTVNCSRLDENGKEIPGTVISREYSAKWKPGVEPYYPLNDEKNTALYQKYKALAEKEKNVVFGGRLGEYKYYDMDKVVESALELCKKEL